MYFDIHGLPIRARRQEKPERAIQTLGAAARAYAVIPKDTFQNLGAIRERSDSHITWIVAVIVMEQDHRRMQNRPVNAA